MRMCLMLALSVSALTVRAQVTIGAETAPKSYSILELVSNGSGGLRLPHMSTAERNQLSDPSTFKSDADGQGLTIYNTTSGCIEFWNIEERQWISLCGEKTGLVDFSNCELIKVVGVYDMDKPLNLQTVRIDIPVVVRKQGVYSYSATCNGVTFSATGLFTSLGPITVNLFIDPAGGTPTSAGTYPATVTISPVDASPSPDPITVTCNNVNVKFVSRSTSTLKILNIAGNENYTGLITGGNYNTNTVYARIGTWLQGGSAAIDGTTLQAATTYSGTQAIQVVNIAYNSMASLQEHLQDASIVWAGASENYSYGFAQLIREWNISGKGVVMVTGDKVAESTVSDALGYYVEDGSTAIGTTRCSLLPQVFSSTNGAPFNLGDGLQIPYSGANCGYVSSNSGVVFMRVSTYNYPSAFADIDRSVFIFGDKFGAGTTVNTNWNNFAKVLADIFAWALKTAPIY